MKKKMGILTSNKRSGWHLEQLKPALLTRDWEVELFSCSEFNMQLNPCRLLSGDKNLEKLSVLLIRGIPAGSLEQIIFRMDSLHYLAKRGVRVINDPGAIEKTVDKYYTSALLWEAGLPAPRTVVTEKFHLAMSAFLEMGDVIVKPLFGSMGRGMVRVSDLDMAYRVFTALRECNYVFYIQEFIEHVRKDLRVMVIGDKVIAAMERIGPSWKSNIHQGGEAVAISISSDLGRSCLQAARVLGLDYAGVDVIISGDSYYMLEVNSIPAWQALQGVTEIDIAGSLVDYIELQYEKGEGD